MLKVEHGGLADVSLSFLNSSLPHPEIGQHTIQQGCCVLKDIHKASEHGQTHDREEANLQAPTTLSVPAQRLLTAAPAA